MKISKPVRGIYKQKIRALMAAKPGINNLELASQIGVHRNTVTKLLEEIEVENDSWVRERWKKLLNDVTKAAEARNHELLQLWADSYRSLYYRHPSQLVIISKANWNILKDLYRMHLEYMGIRQSPKSLVQINFEK